MPEPRGCGGCRLIHYRRFRNSDPPHLFELCRQIELGRGAAQPAAIDAFEVAVYSLPYFDPDGLIIAEDDGKVVGFVHAGFGFSEDLNSIDKSRGVICWLVVRHDYQHRGCGRELLAQAERYLLERGVKSLQAGQSRYCDPFYFGLYGGAKCSGFLESDEKAGPFLQKAGYQPTEKTLVLQRDLKSSRDPMNIKLMGLRRRSELLVMEQPEQPTMWWLTHFGNIESMYFCLVDKKSKSRIASLTVVGLDHYLTKWHERVIGLVDVYVEQEYRGQGFTTTLVLETLKRLRSDFITRAEIHVPEDLQTMRTSINTAGFTPVDASIVYTKPVR